MPRRRQHVDEVANLVVGAMLTWIDHQFDWDLGKFPGQSPDDLDRRIVGIAHPEHDLKFRIVLHKKGFEAFVQPDLRTTQGLQDRDGRMLHRHGGAREGCELPDNDRDQSRPRIPTADDQTEDAEDSRDLGRDQRKFPASVTDTLDALSTDERYKTRTPHESDRSFDVAEALNQSKNSWLSVTTRAWA